MAMSRTQKKQKRKAHRLWWVRELMKEEVATAIPGLKGSISCHSIMHNMSLAHCSSSLVTFRNLRSLIAFSLAVTRNAGMTLTYPCSKWVLQSTVIEYAICQTLLHHPLSGRINKNWYRRWSLNYAVICMVFCSLLQLCSLISPKLTSLVLL